METLRIGLLILERIGFRSTYLNVKGAMRTLLMFVACWPRSWIGSLDWYLHWKTRPQGKASLKVYETVANIKQKKHRVFMFLPMSQSPVEKQDGGRCHAVLVWDVERQHRLTADWRFTIHLTLSHSISSHTFTPPPTFWSVCLILSVDSGRVVMSSSHILRRIQVLREERDWEFRFFLSFGLLSLRACTAVNEVKVCLWWVRPAKRGIRTLNLYRFELF